MNAGVSTTVWTGALLIVGIYGIAVCIARAIPGADRSKRIALTVYQSPEFTIEKAFARLKAMLRKAAERTVEGLWDLIGKLVDLFQPAECTNYFSSCGYDPE